MTLLRPLTIVACAVGLLLAGDRLLAAWLQTWIERSPQIHAEIYTGRAQPVDTLFIGSSRSREHFPAQRIGKRTKTRAANLGWGGLSSEQVEAIFLDFVDRYGPPRVLVIEVTSPEVDGLMIRNLRLFEPYSPRIRTLVAQAEPILFGIGEVFNLLLYNNKLFFDMVRYELADEDYLTEATIDRRALREIRSEDRIGWEYRSDDVDAIGRTVRAARALGAIVAPVITPILPDYLRRLDGFDRWRREIRDVLPSGTRLWDYSGAIDEVQSFRDDLHLNERGVMELMRIMRQDGLPGLAR